MKIHKKWCYRVPVQGMVLQHVTRVPQRAYLHQFLALRLDFACKPGDFRIIRIDAPDRTLGAHERIAACPLNVRQEALRQRRTDDDVKLACVQATKSHTRV